MPEVLDGSDAVFVELQLLKRGVVVKAIYLAQIISCMGEFLKSKITMVTLRLLR